MATTKLNLNGINELDLIFSGVTTAILSSPGVVAVTNVAPVLSVFGRTGAVVAETGDYTVAEVTGAAPIASPTFTGTVTAPTLDATTIGVTNITVSGFLSTTDAQITGGAINGTTIGASAPDTVAATTLTSSGDAILAGSFRAYEGASDTVAAYADIRTNLVTGTMSISPPSSALYLNDDHGSGVVNFCAGTTTPVASVSATGMGTFTGGLTVGAEGATEGVEFLPAVTGAAIFGISNPGNNTLVIGNGGGFPLLDPMTIDNSGNVKATGTITGTQHIAQIGTTVIQMGTAPSYALEGSALTWNVSGSTGETDFVNMKGGGAGGFNWYNIADGGTPSTAIMGLNSSGSLTTGSLNMTAQSTTSYPASSATLQAVSGTAYFDSVGTSTTVQGGFSFRGITANNTNPDTVLLDILPSTGGATFAGAVTAPSFTGFSTLTNNGYTGGGTDPSFSTPAAWAAIPWGYTNFVSAASPGAPVNADYGYFIKLANRDTNGGWGGLYLDYDTGVMYTGVTGTSTSNATWSQGLFVSATATSATAGSASALPATPLGYVEVSLPAIGSTVKIPYYSV